MVCLFHRDTVALCWHTGANNLHAAAAVFQALSWHEMPQEHGAGGEMGWHGVLAKANTTGHCMVTCPGALSFFPCTLLIFIDFSVNLSSIIWFHFHDEKKQPQLAVSAFSF